MYRLDPKRTEPSNHPSLTSGPYRWFEACCPFCASHTCQQTSHRHWPILSAASEKFNWRLVTPTFFRNEPFGEKVELLSYYGKRRTRQRSHCRAIGRRRTAAGLHDAASPPSHHVALDRRHAQSAVYDADACTSSPAARRDTD